MKLTDLLMTYNSCHSEFQIDHFIVGRGRTTWGCYKQAVREIITRTEALRVLILDSLAPHAQSVRFSQINSQRTKDDLNPCDRPTTMEHFQIYSAVRELERFLFHVIQLREALGPLSELSCGVHEQDFWVHQARESLAKDLIEYSRPTSSTLELIVLLPKRCRQVLLRVLFDPHERESLIRWYLNQDASCVTQDFSYVNSIGSCGKRLEILYRHWFALERKMRISNRMVCEVGHAVGLCESRNGTL